MNIATPNFDSITLLSSICKRFFKKKISVVFEFGARYCEDSLEFSKTFPESIIYSFECNPATLDKCREIVTQNNRIILIESAIGDFNGTTNFYPINKQKTLTTWSDGNQGASSLFKASGNYPIEKYVQDEIQVPIKTAYTFINEMNINQIDILWMDIQGAELIALKGFGDKLKDVKIIHTEVEFFEIYDKQPLFDDINKFLLKNDFLFYGFSYRGEFAADAIFINKKYLSFFQKLKIHLEKKLSKNNLLN